MGREIKRVPLDFDWPLDKVWQGFLLPERFHEDPCPDCCHGLTPARAWVEQMADLLLMLDDDVRDQERGRETHPYFESLPKPYGNERDRPTAFRAIRPSADIRELGTGLAGREGSVFGHDACDRWSTANKIIAAAGLDPDVWGICQRCCGHASIERYAGQRDEAESWRSTGPPEGEGWQLWETVSEGSPISPVFATGEELAGWMASPAYTWGASSPLTIEQATAFVKAGWATSLVFDSDHGLRPGEAIYADD